MRCPARFRQSDLFAADASISGSLPEVTRTELVSLLSALLLEVMTYQDRQPSAVQESDDEQQDHA